MADQTALATQTAPTINRPGIVAKFGERYDLDPAKVMGIVAQTIFRQGSNEQPLSNEEVAAALIVANAYELNPFTKELYAFRSKGKLLIVVGVDGWSTIVNRQPQMNGIDFEEHFDDKGIIHAVTCKIFRKDRALPIVVTEYTHECRRDTVPWNTMPIRMTRNRAFVQCARIAFSISGIVDDDEANTIEGAPEFNSRPIDLELTAGSTRTDTVKQVIQHRKARTNGQQETQADSGQTQAQPAEPAQPVVEAQPQTQQSQPAQDGNLW